jgi:hypothetical protein
MDKYKFLEVIGQGEFGIVFKSQALKSGFNFLMTYLNKSFQYFMYNNIPFNL